MNASVASEYRYCVRIAAIAMTLAVGCSQGSEDVNATASKEPAPTTAVLPAADAALADPAMQVVPPAGNPGNKPPTTQTPTPDGGAAAADSGVADTADGGAQQTCCCKAEGSPLEMVGMSDCNKTRKGACVKKEQCGGAAAADAGPPAGGQNCCCEAAGKFESVAMKECTGIPRKGKCVKADKCKN